MVALSEVLEVVGVQLEQVDVGQNDVHDSCCAWSSVVCSLRQQGKSWPLVSGVTSHGNVPFCALCQKHSDALMRTSGTL